MCGTNVRGTIFAYNLLTTLFIRKEIERDVESYKQIVDKSWVPSNTLYVAHECGLGRKMSNVPVIVIMWYHNSMSTLYKSICSPYF